MSFTPFIALLTVTQQTRQWSQRHNNDIHDTFERPGLSNARVIAEAEGAEGDEEAIHPHVPVPHHREDNTLLRQRFLFHDVRPHNNHHNYKQ